MNKRILIAGLCDTNLKESLEGKFDISESLDSEDTQLTLLSQYRLIKVVLISMELFCRDNYRIMDKIQTTVILKHIPVICIGSTYNNNTSEQNLDYNDALDHGALDFCTFPIDISLLTKYVKNIITLKDYSYYASAEVMNDATKNYETELSSGTYWNPKSLDSIIMRTTIGAACIIESIYENVTVVKTNDDFINEIFGKEGKEDSLEEADIEHFFDNYLDLSQRQIFLNALDSVLKSKDTKAECNLEFKRTDSSQTIIHIRIVMRLIERINERALVYCMMENDTDKYVSINVERDLMMQMQIIIKNINCGITIAYDDFSSIKYEFANDLFYSTFGYTKEEFEEEDIQTLQDLIMPDYYFEVKTGINNARTQRRPFVLVFQARKKDGTIIWVKVRSSVCFMKAKGKTAFITTYEDITSMKASEDRLQSINEKLTSSEVYIQLNLTDRLIEEYHSNYEPENNNLSNQYRDYQELLLLHVYEKEKGKTWETLSYDNLLKNYYAGNTKLSVEYRRHMPDRSIKWFTATAVIISGRNKGDIHAFIYVHEDDTIIKTRIAKDRIMDSDVSDITIINVASGLCRNIKIYDSVIEESDNLKRYIDNLNLFIDTEVIQEDRDKCREYFSLANLIEKVKEKGLASTSFWIMTKNGANVRKSATATFLDSTKEDLLLVGRDITELFEKEKEQQMALKNAAKMAEMANQAKSDFLSRMSHDMRTPLNAILGLAELAEEEEQITEMKNYMHNIDVSGHFLLSLINDTLDLSKIESGKMELHREPFPLQEFVMGIETVIRPLMEAKNIQFEVNLKKQISNIAVDRVRINQLFYNLLSNAAKYTPVGGKVEFFSEPIEPKGNMTGMRFHVCDNGIGMSREYQKILFEPFSQEYGAVQKEQQGTGLGLAIVKQIVDLAKGKIEVISELGKGTEFIVDMYAVGIDDIDSLPAEQKIDYSKLCGLHILVADDTEINAFIVKKMLELKGSIVDIVRNGQEAYDMFMKSDKDYYDIILTDIRMPVMNGFEEAVKIRALEREDAKAIPIIAATADAYENIKEKILEAGMNKRLVKPIEADKLCKTIIELVECRQNHTT